MKQVVEAKVVIRVRMDSKWGDDCTLGQVRKQASREAYDKITKALEGSSDMKVMAILLERVSWVED